MALELDLGFDDVELEFDLPSEDMAPWSIFKNWDTPDYFLSMGISNSPSLLN